MRMWDAQLVRPPSSGPAACSARGSGLGAPADIDAFNRKIVHLEQPVTDLRMQIEERDSELTAARAAHRELMTQLTGVDISAAMLGRARTAGPENITYIHADVTRDLSWWDGRPFDGCTCEMALMDIDDLAGALAAVTSALRPDGWFVASIVHPCLPASQRGASSWPPGQGYECEGWWISPDHHSPESIRIRVGATHRKLSTYLNALRDAGLDPEHFAEPPAPVPTYLL
jgi:SAM-dependent methyltransferase